MPPIIKYTKEDIINTALEIVKKEGFDGLNARKLAKELGSSIQPIFHKFSSMEELKKELSKIIYAKYQEYMHIGKNEEKYYKKMGLSYIKFAKDYPEYFKIIFMQSTKFNAEEFMMSDHNLGKEVIAAGQKLTGFNFEEQKKFHLKVWIFTHGLACLIATNTISIDEEQINELLEKTVMELLKGYKGENHEKYNRS